MRWLMWGFLVLSLPIQLQSGMPKGEPASTFESPDNTFMIVQYADKTEDLWKWESWVFPKSDDPSYKLSRLHDFHGYPGRYDLSPDHQCLVRSQKIGSGEATIYLYKRAGGTKFRSVCNGSFGDLAWDFFTKQPEISSDMVPSFHQYVQVKEWRTGGIALIELSGMHFLDATRWVTDDWQCLYDLSTETFQVTPDIRKSNQSKIYPLKGGIKN